MTRKHADMITSEPQIVSPTLRPATSHYVDEGDYIVGPVPLAALPAHYRVIKRIFDFTAALLALIVLSPLILLISLAIKLDDGDPVIIVQKRVGLGGKVFDFYKFRSMVHHLDHSQTNREFAQKVIRGEITQAPKENGGLLKPASNGRVITRVGKILRKTSLDELPQLINVLRGEMSLVGPRPERPYFVEKLSKEFPLYKRRLKVRPGVTGWAQVKHKYDETLDDVKTKLRFDLFYIENMSLRMDFKILFRTIFVVLFGKGHFE